MELGCDKLCMASSGVNVGTLHLAARRNTSHIPQSYQESSVRIPTRCTALHSAVVTAVWQLKETHAMCCTNIKPCLQLQVPMGMGCPPLEHTLHVTTGHQQHSSNHQGMHAICLEGPGHLGQAGGCHQGHQQAYPAHWPAQNTPMASA